VSWSGWAGQAGGRSWDGKHQRGEKKKKKKNRRRENASLSPAQQRRTSAVGMGGRRRQTYAYHLHPVRGSAKGQQGDSIWTEMNKRLVWAGGQVWRGAVKAGVCKRGSRLEEDQTGISQAYSI